MSLTVNPVKAPQPPTCWGFFSFSMKQVTVDYQFAKDFGLNATQAILHAYLCKRHFYAQEFAVLNGVQYSPISYSELCKELSMLTDKEDTMYRVLRSLHNNGSIQLIMHPKASTAVHYTVLEFPQYKFTK